MKKGSLSMDNLGGTIAMGLAIVSISAIVFYIMFWVVNNYGKNLP